MHYAPYAGQPRAFFDGPRGRATCFCLHHVPASAPRGAVLHVAAFAEEMNKSRRATAQAARALAKAGHVVLQLDLTGTGDALGDFADARWEDWLDEVQWAIDWLRQRHDAPLWLWGHRLGAVLAAQAAARGGVACHHLLWQPVMQGRQVVRNFLRLRAAAGWAGPGAKTVVEATRAELAAGRLVEIAGYGLHPALAAALEVAVLEPPPLHGDSAQRLVWLEVAGDEPALMPTSLAAVGLWATAGYVVDAKAVSGPPFWQTVEIEDAHALVDATCAALEAAAGGFAPLNANETA